MDNERTFISEDYEGLLLQYKSLRQELDVVKQQLHDSTRQAKLSETLLRDYQSEIELLQNGDRNEKEKLETKIVNLEEAINNLRLAHSEKLTNIEAKLIKKEQENEDLKIEIDLLKKSNCTENDGELSMEFEEVLSLKSANELLKKSYEELLEHYASLQNQHTEVEILLEQHKEEISQLKESLEVKRNEVAENTVLIEKLNDDLFCVRKELETYRSKPLDEGSKGNSLFAEVDDRRVYLQKTVNNMKTDYVRIKQEKMQFVKQISHLRKVNADLQSMWRKDLEQIDEDKQMVVDSLNNNLKILQDMIDEQKAELEQKAGRLNDNLSPEYQFYQDVIKSKTKEVYDLQEKLSKKSLGEYLLTTSLNKANKKIRQLKLKVMEFEEQRQNLSEEQTTSCEPIVEHRHNPIYGIDSVPLQKSCLKSKENVLRVDQNEETLDLDTSKHNHSVDAFNIFHNRRSRREIERKENYDCPAPDFNTEVHTNSFQSNDLDITASVEDKENKDVYENMSNLKKKGVTFSEDTTEGSGPARRNCTLIVSAPKKMF
ncbi:protein Spindly-like [Sitophilus oryzae]|uniref:Protein Spindly-like n=1 Tax=Sitophilus oryzae TaxID=7048 RepID=A0A6J2YMU9_SITOR|nr:protein Spindly-like [Sitophilus oryzae]